MDELVAKINDVTQEDVKGLACELFRKDRQILAVIGSVDKKDIVHN